MDRVITLYELLTSYATNQQQRDIVATYLKELRKAYGHNDSLIEKALLGAIFEGLYYGNWIWVLRGK